MANSPKIDKFSGLPFVLVIKIINLLTFSHAYMLCLLRPEWLEAQLWRNCCAIDLHEKFHLSRARMRQQLRLGHEENAKEIKCIDRINFWHFANKAIHLVDLGRITRFSLQISFTTNLTHTVNNWLSIILSKHIKAITLDFADRDTLVSIPNNLYEVPSFFFEGRVWVKIIRLFSCVIPNECNFRGFTNLTTSVLHGIRFKGININDSFVGCAMLENLYIVECFGILKVEIGSELTCLTKLVVQNCETFREGIEFIYAPQLEHFEYHGTLIQFNFIGTFILDNVILDFVDSSYPYIFPEIDDYFSQILYPRYFTMTTPALHITPIEYMYGVPFISLLYVEVLTIKTSMNIFEIPPILTLLKGAKYMSSLIFAPFAMSSDMVDVHNQWYQHHIDLPSCIWDPTSTVSLPVLERVEFGGFSGKDLELKVLNFILKCSKKLRKVVLKLSRGMELHQIARSGQFQALKAELGAYSRVKFEWRYS